MIHEVGTKRIYVIVGGLVYLCVFVRRVWGYRAHNVLVFMFGIGESV